MTSNDTTLTDLQLAVEDAITTLRRTAIDDGLGLAPMAKTHEATVVLRKAIQALCAAEYLRGFHEGQITETVTCVADLIDDDEHGHS